MSQALAEPRTAAWQEAGANARRKGGKRAKILAADRRLKDRDPGERARIIAEKYGITAIYVRRVLKSDRVKSNKPISF